MKEGIVTTSKGSWRFHLSMILHEAIDIAPSRCALPHVFTNDKPHAILKPDQVIFPEMKRAPSNRHVCIARSSF